MDNCPTCGQSISGVTAEMIDRLVDWDDFDYSTKGDTEIYDGLGEVELMVEPQSKTYDSYGGVLQEDIFIVVKVQGRLFKKEGTRSSYGSIDWDGDCREVKAEPKTITVFDYV